MRIFTKNIGWPLVSLLLFSCCSVTHATSKISERSNDPLVEASKLLQAENYSEALQVYLVEANKDNGLAQFNVALFYDLGWGVHPDAQEACTWFNKAAINGIPMAMQRTGQCISEGIINAQSGQTTALDWYMQAASLGIYDSLCLAGKLLLSANRDKEPEPNPKLTDKGIQLCIEGAQKGSISAQATLGKWYYTGTHVKQNYQVAFELLIQAVNKSDGDTAFLLAQYYDKGIGMPIDTALALKYYEIAASKGKYEAYLPTALLYWQAYSSDAKSELLAKSYLWGAVACAVNNHDAKNEQLLFSVLKNEVPKNWVDELDTKAKSHLFKHHPFKRHQANSAALNNCNV